MSARDRIHRAMTEPTAWGHYTPETADSLLDSYRAEVLREAADDLESSALGGVLVYAAARMRRKADAAEVQQRLTDAAARYDAGKDTREGESTHLSGGPVEQSASRLRAFLAPSDGGEDR